MLRLHSIHLSQGLHLRLLNRAPEDLPLALSMFSWIYLAEVVLVFPSYTLFPEVHPVTFW